MALYKRKEFYQKCGVSKAYLTTYIGRGKVILTGKMIDDYLPENAYFMKIRLDKMAVKGQEEGLSVLEKPSKPLTDKDINGLEDSNLKENEDGSLYKLSLEKKQLDIERAKEEIEIARLKKEKLSGDLIPTDLVRIVFATHSKSITINFHQAVENILSQIAKQAGLDRDQIAKIRGSLIEIINKGVKNALAASKKDLKNIVAEYSQKRGRGERE